MIIVLQGLPKKNGDPIARQIAANRGKSRQNPANFVLKKMAITFLKNRDRSHPEGIPENNGDHFGGKI